MSTQSLPKLPEGTPWALNEAFRAAVSKETAKREAATEQRIRNRARRDRKATRSTPRRFRRQVLGLYSAIKPQPLTVREIQTLLLDSEMLLAYATGDKGQPHLRGNPLERGTEIDSALKGGVVFEGRALFGVHSR
jgi:hypothetical protein